MRRLLLVAPLLGLAVTAGLLFGKPETARAQRAEGCDLTYDLDKNEVVDEADRDILERWMEDGSKLADLNENGSIEKMDDYLTFLRMMYSEACRQDNHLLDPGQVGGLPLNPSDPNPSVAMGMAQTDGVDAADAVDAVSSLDLTGGPDGFGYTFKDSNEGGCPVNFVSIVGNGGVNLNLTDDSNSTQTLNFPFSFYGTPQASVGVASNGYLHFGSVGTDFSNDCPIPNTLTPNNAIYGHWDDLLPSGAGNVYAANYAAGQCPGGRPGACFIAEWNNVPYFSGGGTVTFQIILHEDGVIETQYQTLTQTGTSATAGLENSTGTVALQYACNTAWGTPLPKAVYYLPPGVTSCQQAAGGAAGVDPNRQLGCQVHLPILNFQGQDDVCRSMIEVQYIGCEPSKAVLVTWGEPGFCPPQAAGPLKVECTGLLFPGSSWIMMGAQIPTGSKGGMLFKFTAQQLTDVGIDLGFDDIVADLMCETLFFGVVGDADDYRRFKKAYNEGLDFAGINQRIAMGSGFLAVEVLRHCPGDVTPGVEVSSKYNGIAAAHLGSYDPVFGGYAYWVPLVYANKGGLNTIIYIQNGGLECSSLELWFRATDDCLRARICDVSTLAPGETYQFDASDCVGPDWQGTAWVRASEPMGLAVDIYGADVLTTHIGEPDAYVYPDPIDEVFAQWENVAFGPLIYSEYQGWDTGVTVVNVSPVTAAKVKVYFLDRSGDVITTLVDWICPRGNQVFWMPVIADLPGNWVGSMRIESQIWWTPGTGPIAAPPIAGGAVLVKYSDVARTAAEQAIAYNLLPEHKSYIWQVGSGEGNLFSGVGLIAIPSLLKDLDGSGVTSELSIMNLVAKPGFTDFAIYIYDQNGLLDFVCQKLHDRQVEYIDLQTWGYVNNGFKGSAVISATFWEHDVFDPDGRFVRNLVGLGAVSVERTGTRLGEDIPGDEAAGERGIPFAAAEIGDDWCPGGEIPRCPGQPIYAVVQADFAASETLGVGTLGTQLPIVTPFTLSRTVTVSGVPADCKISDVNVDLSLTTTFMGDVTATLAHSGTTSTLFDFICGSNDNLSVTLDDDAANPVSGTSPMGACLAPTNATGTYKTEAGTALNAFDKKFAAGAWTLNLTDTATGDPTYLNAWGVKGTCTYRQLQP